MPSNLTAVDLFAGLGGTSLGARRAGLRVIVAANHWRPAVEAHRANHPGVFHFLQDLQQANFHEWPDFDVYYFRHRQWVFGGILLCNLVALSVSFVLGSRFLRSPLGVANLVTYFIPLVALLAVRNRRANIALLLVLLVRYAIIPELAVLGVGMHSELF